MKLQFALAFAAASVIATTNVEAASDATTAFIAHVRQHAVFLDQASKLAADHSASDKIKAFAAQEAEGQGKVLDRLRGPTHPMLTADASTPNMDSTMDGNTPAAPDAMLTGRSAAIDTTVGWSDPAPGVVMASPSVIVMPYLSTLNGADFDKLYTTTQIVSLTELAGFYKAYKETGDDPALRAMATRELEVVNARLDDLKKL